MAERAGRHSALYQQAGALCFWASAPCRSAIAAGDDRGRRGFQSAEAMIREGYGLEPAEVEIAVAWLRLNHPDEPVGLPKVLKLGQHGGARNAKCADEQGVNHTLVRGTGNRDYTLARLDRDHPEIAAEVRAGARVGEPYIWLNNC